MGGESEQRAVSGFDPGNKRFEVIRELGRGSFGVVYEAIDCALGDSPVALKLLTHPHVERLYRFKNEFRALAEVRHRNLVQLHELVASRSGVFFTMELLEGESPLQFAQGDFDKARDVTRQVAEGLQTLHRAGKLHRDVKPSNILVERTGRAVLLDFGLAVDLEVQEAPDRAGTPRYMSPEQCAGQPLTEASDWYALGAVLFEMLTGHAPFEGTVDQLLTAKRSSTAPRAGTLATVPGDLDDLCAELLSLDPCARPSGADVLARLEAPAAPVVPEAFVGRAFEKAELLRRYDETAAGRATVVMVGGPSGIGKTALLRHGLEALRAREPAPLILAGRCFEFESVPYKALDAVIDELARELRSFEPRELTALLPRDAWAVAALFPTLRRLPAFARATPRARAADAADVRRRGLTALRELFTGLAARRPLVICIDDVQWGDADSAELIAELLRAPDAPAICWLLGFREEEATSSPLLAALASFRLAALAEVPFVELELGGLDAAEAVTLASTLLAGSEPEAHARALAAESHGSPFFLHELARAGGPDRALSELVRRRVDRLEGAARRVLQVVAVAAEPIELEVVAACAGLSGELRAAVTTLRAEHLARAREGHARLIECYHDRIREAVVAQLEAPELAATHLALAAALEARGANAAQIGRHLADGGDPRHAQEHLVRAARAAAAALAFEEAARLLRRALELGRFAGAKDDTLELELEYAEVLSQAGHGQQAAQLWLSRVGSVSRDRGIELMRRAVEELLIAGQTEQGYAAMTALLATLELSVPETTAKALAMIAKGRIDRGLFGLDLRPREKPLSQLDLQRLDTLGSLSWSVVQLEPLKGYAMQTEHLALALRSGDPRRAAYALWLEAPVAAMKGSQGSEYTRQIIERADELAKGLDVPDIARLTVEGIVALMEGRWADGLRELDAADESGNTSLIGHSSLRGSIHAMRAMNLFWMGRSGDLLRRLPAQLRELERHGHLYGWLWLRLLEAWALSCSGRMKEAWAASEHVRSKLPAGVFEIHRWYLEFGQVKYLLLEDQAVAAWHRLEELRRKHRFTLVGQSQRVSGLWVRANAALGRAVAEPSSRAEMLREARTMVKRLEREQVGWVDALAATVRAQVAAVAGDTGSAVHQLADAEPKLAAHQLEAVLAFARLRRGEVLGGDQGRALVAQAHEWLTQQRVAFWVSRVVLAGPWNGDSAQYASLDSSRSSTASSRPRSSSETG